MYNLYEEFMGRTGFVHFFLFSGSKICVLYTALTYRGLSGYAHLMKQHEQLPYMGRMRLVALTTLYWTF